MSEIHHDVMMDQCSEKLDETQPTLVEPLAVQQPPQDDPQMPQTIPNQNDQDTFEDLSQSLFEDVPQDVELSIPESPTAGEINLLIEKHNDIMVNALNDAKLAAIWSFVKNEKERTERQKPLLFIVAGLTVIQLLAFNGIIGVAVWLVFKNGRTEVITHFIDLLKYYIGATVVELLSMLAYITTGTFSTNHVKTMNKLLGNLSGKKEDHENDKPHAGE